MMDRHLVAALESLAREHDAAELQVAARLTELAMLRLRLRQTARQRWQALSPREREAALLVREGCSNRQIAARLVVSLGTVKQLVWRAMHKMQLASPQELRTMMRAIDWEDEHLRAAPAAQTSEKPPGEV
jgi:DNA-binding NarL/FixJ family response regulator